MGDKRNKSKKKSLGWRKKNVRHMISVMKALRTGIQDGSLPGIHQGPSTSDSNVIDLNEFEEENVKPIQEGGSGPSGAQPTPIDIEYVNTETNAYQQDTSAHTFESGAPDTDLFADVQDSQLSSDASDAGAPEQSTCGAATEEACHVSAYAAAAAAAELAARARSLARGHAGGPHRTALDAGGPHRTAPDAGGPHRTTPDSSYMAENSSSFYIFRNMTQRDEKTMQLIDLYQKEECLWNTNIEDFRNKRKRNEAAERIAKIMDIPRFGARDVITKLRNLKSSFSQELRKIANRQAAGDGSYKPTVVWFQKMNSFIRPHLQPPSRGAPHARVSRIEGTEERLQHINPDEVVVATEISYPCGSDNETEPVHKSKIRNTSDISSSNSKRSKRNSGSDEQNTSMRRQTTDTGESDSDSEVQNNIAASFKDVSDKLNVLITQKEDVYDNFGKYVAGLLRNLPPRKALEVQPQIIGLITAASLDHLLIQVESQQDPETVVFKLEK